MNREINIFNWILISVKQIGLINLQTSNEVQSAI